GRMRGRDHDGLRARTRHRLPSGWSHRIRSDGGRRARAGEVRHRRVVVGAPVSREYPDYPRVGVGAVILDGDRVLLIQRGGVTLPGKWSIPGGLVELGETTRERSEERRVGKEGRAEVRRAQVKRNKETE